MPAGSKAAHPSAYVATHDPFGMHQKLAQAFDLVQALDNLEQHFAFFETSQHIHELISTYISRFPAPSLIMANMNQTLPRYRIDAAAQLEEIRALNSLDVRLYERVRTQPRRPRLQLNDRSLSPMTIYLEEFEKGRRSLQKPHHHRTESLSALLAGPAAALRDPTWDA